MGEEKLFSILLVPVLVGVFLELIHCQHINTWTSTQNSVRNNFGDEIEKPIELEDTYDFIVVGSGSSGAVIANRLSENPSWKILLLEAGNPGNFLTKIPVMAPLFQLTPYNWNYTMERQENVCLAMENQICAWPRGKAVGGTSLINYMIYTRGNPKDYNKWAEFGNEGWSYEDVLPYFLKSENCNLGKEICSQSYHSSGGNLNIAYPYKSKITQAFLEAGMEMGEKIVDYNTDDYMGFSQIQATIKNGKRHSTADAFIYPVLNYRNNLKLFTSTRVTKILIESQSKEAYGVRFRKRGKEYIAKATKEVILSAGVFGSPQLLMLSGIGPEEHLQELDITTVQNLPVGQSLYDHIGYVGLAFTINETVESKEALLNPKEISNWIFQGRGVYTSLGGIEALAYINTGSIADTNYPDIELIFSGVGSLEADLGLVVAKELRVRQEVYDKLFKPIEQTPAWSIIPMLLHPKSRGFLKLRSKDPYDTPLLFGGYFTDPEETDINTFLASIRYIQKLSKTDAFQRYNSKLHGIPIPGCESHNFDSDDYWKCALRSLSTSLHHQIGTCKMGHETDSEAVVNSRLKVHGVKGLRVADSSIIPVTLSAHTNAPSIMIGEKASDIIKEDWGML